MCQGQQQSAALGYSPMPINLVEASFNQIAKIPGADVQSINIQGCNNPTFTPSGANLLAETAPYPPACDKQGPIQCTTGTGGAAAATPISAGAPEASSGAAGGAGSAGASGSSSTTAVAGSAGAQGAGGAASAAACAGKSGCSSAGPSDAPPRPLPSTLDVRAGWSVDQTLMALIAAVLLAAVLLPGLLSGRFSRRKR